MDFTHADFPEDLSMPGRAVAFILQKVVLGKLAVIHLHDPVARNLGDDGRGDVSPPVSPVQLSAE